MAVGVAADLLGQIAELRVPVRMLTAFETLTVRLQAKTQISLQNVGDRPRVHRMTVLAGLATFTVRC
jgi:hypothetical protein